MWLCHYCRFSLSLDTQKKNRLCPNCGSDLHCCKNCSFFDENLTSKCREPNSPWVADRSTTNPCTHFDFKISKDSSTPAPTGDALSEVEKAKKAFLDLFR